MIQLSTYLYGAFGFGSSCSHLDFAPLSSKEFLDIQASIESGFTLKRVRDMTRTYSQEKICFTSMKPNHRAKR